MPDFVTPLLIRQKLGVDIPTTDPGDGSAWKHSSGAVILGPSFSPVISDITGLQAALDTKAADSDVVHIEGAETITGIKTLANGVLLGSSLNGATVNALVGGGLAIKNFAGTADAPITASNVTASGTIYTNTILDVSATPITLGQSAYGITIPGTVQLNKSGTGGSSALNFSSQNLTIGYSGTNPFINSYDKTLLINTYQNQATQFGGNVSINGTLGAGVTTLSGTALSTILTVIGTSLEHKMRISDGTIAHWRGAESAPRFLLGHEAAGTVYDGLYFSAFNVGLAASGTGRMSFYSDPGSGIVEALWFNATAAGTSNNLFQVTDSSGSPTNTIKLTSGTFQHFYAFEAIPRTKLGFNALGTTYDGLYFAAFGVGLGASGSGLSFYYNGGSLTDVANFNSSKWQFNTIVQLNTDTRLNRSAAGQLKQEVYHSGLATWQETVRHEASLSGGMWGVFGNSALQQTGGVMTAGAAYTANEQSMIQKSYNCLRTFGLLN